MPNRLQQVIAATLAGSLACAHPSTDPSEPGFGLGPKADDIDGCDAAADLCWGQDDSATMRSILLAHDSLALMAVDGPTGARQLVDGVLSLSHKLSADEIAAIRDLHTVADALASTPEAAAEFIGELHEAGYGRLVATYVTAYMVPVGRSVEAQADGSADDPDGLASLELPTLHDGISPGERASLDALYKTDTFGKIYAFALEHTGVLEQATPLFDEMFPFSEPREDRAQRIIERWQWAQAGSTFLANAEALIPVAGIGVSFSHSLFFNFRIRMRMTLEIAALYGIDIDADLNLLRVVSAFIAAQKTPDIRGQVFGWPVVSAIASALLKKKLGLDPTALSRTLLADLVTALSKKLSTEGATVAARALSASLAASTKRQILGLATLGLFIFADVTIAVRITGAIGQDMDAALRPWGLGMVEEGARAFGTPHGRECAARLLGLLANADDEISDAERMLLAAHLTRPWFDDEQGWQRSDDEEIADLAATAALAPAPGDLGYEAEFASVGRCAEESWGELEIQDRNTVLATGLVTTMVDGTFNPTESVAYEKLVTPLGDDLDDFQKDAMYTAIYGMLVAPESSVPASWAQDVAALEVSDLLPFLADVTPAARDVVDCAFDGDC